VYRIALLTIEISAFFVWGLCLATNAWAQRIAQDRWAEVTRDANSSTWLDTTTIAKQDSTRYAWHQLRYFETRQIAGRPYDKASTRTRYNCETGESSLLHGVYYLGDSVVYSLPFDNSRLSPPPGSVGERLFEYVCGKKSFPPRGIAGDPLSTSLGWRVLSPPRGGSAIIATTSVDTPSIVRNQSTVTIWSRTVYPAPIDQAPNIYNEVHVRADFNCALRQTRISAVTLWLNNRTVTAQEDKTPGWTAIEPGSTGETLWQYVCTQRRKTPRRTR
jgi:hypothetical protein